MRLPPTITSTTHWVGSTGIHKEGLYLYEVTQLRWKDENVRGDGHLAVALELLIIHVNVLHRWVQRVETVKLKQKYGFQSCWTNTIRGRTQDFRGPTSSGSACVSVFERICPILSRCNTEQDGLRVWNSLTFTTNKCLWCQSEH